MRTIVFNGELKIPAANFANYADFQITFAKIRVIRGTALLHDAVPPKMGEHKVIICKVNS